MAGIYGVQATSARQAQQAAVGRQQAAAYFARKRRKARAEVTAGDGGLREQKALIGIEMQVALVAA